MSVRRLVWLVALVALIAGSGVSGPAWADPAEDHIVAVKGSDWTFAASKAEAQGVRVEVVAERSETTRIWVHPDGSIEEETALGEVRFADETGPNGWRDIDTTLEVHDDGSIAPKALPVEVKLGIGTDELITYDQGGDGEVGFKLDGLTLPTPVLDGSTATYPDVLSGVDVSVEVRTAGFEVLWVVKTPEAAQKLVGKYGAGVRDVKLPTRLRSKVEPKHTAQGEVELKQPNGTKGGFAAPSMWDSSSTTPGIRGQEFEATFEVESKNRTNDARSAQTTRSMDLAISEEWLTATERVFPIIIDPTYQSVSGAPAFDTWIQQGVTVDKSAASDLRIGNDGTGMVARTFMNFDAALFKNRQVRRASLSLYGSYSSTCTQTEFAAYDAGLATSASRWTAQPTLGNKRSTSTSTVGKSASCPAARIDLDMTPQAQTWSTTSAPRVGMMLGATNVTDAFGWKVFHSSEGQNKPVIAVFYNRNPLTPVAPTVVGTVPATTSTGAKNFIGVPKPTIRVPVQDADIDNITAVISRFTSSTSTTPTAELCRGTALSGGAVTCTSVPDLPANTSVWIRATAGDGLSWSGWGPATEVRFAAVAPLTPVISCPTPNGSSTLYVNPKETCTITAKQGTATASSPVSASYRVNGDAWKTTSFTQITADTKIAEITAGGTKGEHKIEAYVTSPVGKQSNTASYWFSFRDEPVQNSIVRAADFLKSRWAEKRNQFYGAGVVMDGIMALSSANLHRETVEEMLADLKSRAPAYIQDHPAGLAKLLITLDMAGDDHAGEFLGTDRDLTAELISSIKAREVTPQYWGEWGPYLSVIALARLDRLDELNDSDLQYLQSDMLMQEDGGFGPRYPYSEGDPDYTAVGIAATLLLSRSDRISDEQRKIAALKNQSALDWAANSANQKTDSDGNHYWETYSSANSTGMLAAALNEAGVNIESPRRYMVTQQARTSDQSGWGASYNSTRSDVMATAQGIFAMTGTGYATGRFGKLPLKVSLIGDSYSAGNGTEEGECEEDDTSCIEQRPSGGYFGPVGSFRRHRNYAQNYVNKLNDTGRYAASLENLAFSGSVIRPRNAEDQALGDKRWIVEQASKIDPSSDVVLFTAGGNDARFADAVTGCYGLNSMSGPDCFNAVAYGTSMISDIKTGTTEVLSALQMRLISPGTTDVILLGYPYLSLDTSMILSDRDPACDCVREIDAAKDVRRAQAQVNAVQKLLVDEWNRSHSLKVTYVPVADLFSTHEPDPRTTHKNDRRWVNEFFETRGDIDPATGFTVSAPQFGNPFSAGVQGNFYHPNLIGHREEAGEVARVFGIRPKASAAPQRRSLNVTTAVAVDHLVAKEGSILELDARGSYSSTALAQYEWDMDSDGVPDVITSQPVVEYAYPGVFSGEAQLTVTAFDDSTASTSIDVDVTRDGDNIPDEIDNCPDDANHGQDDTDGDGVGDACEV